MTIERMRKRMTALLNSVGKERSKRKRREEREGERGKGDLTMGR